MGIAVAQAGLFGFSAKNIAAGTTMPPRAAKVGRRICLGWLSVDVISNPMKRKKIAIKISRNMLVRVQEIAKAPPIIRRGLCQLKVERVRFRYRNRVQTLLDVDASERNQLRSYASIRSKLR